jgi:hypothetical protein
MACVFMVLGWGGVGVGSSDRELAEVVGISQEALARQADFAGDGGQDIRLGDVVVGIGGRSVEGQSFEEVIHQLEEASRPTKVLFARAVKRITHEFRQRTLVTKRCCGSSLLRRGPPGPTTTQSTP